MAAALISAAANLLSPPSRLEAERKPEHALFDGNSLKGWIDSENSATSFSASDVLDLPALARSLDIKSNGVAAFLSASLDESVRAQLSRPSLPDSPEDRAARSALARNLNKIIAGPSIYQVDRFAGVKLSPETRRLVRRHLHGRKLVELNRALLSETFSAELAMVKPGWKVQDRAIASTGAGRGVLYTVHDYARFRLMFTMRHVSGNPDHQPCVLIFCTRPKPDEVPLDALGGIQFQVPKGGHWDYRPGHNNAGGPEFTLMNKVSFDPHQWSRVEIVADASTGRARMAVAQPVGSRAIEVLDFRDPTAGKPGPIALQMHNAGLFDEYKDLSIETISADLDLITIGQGNPSA